jgi:transposase
VNLDAKRLVFLDESSINTGMTRLYGRALKNERVYDYVPDVRFQRISVLSTINHDGSQVPFVFEGTHSTNQLFKEYIDKMLAPTLLKNDVLVLDNSSVHKSKVVIDALSENGINYLFLPPYSPDLNPIELMWSKVKNKMRKIKAREKNELTKALNTALESIEKKDVENWFKHAGYRATIN